MLRSSARWAPLAAAAAGSCVASRLCGRSSQAEESPSKRVRWQLQRGAIGGGAVVSCADGRMLARNSALPAGGGLRRNIVSDAHCRDEVIEWIKTMLHHSFVLDLPHTYATTWATFEMLVEQHRACPPGTTSRLKEILPTIGPFHTPIPVTKAWLAYDSKYCVSSRRHITPSFNEIRHTLNLAQIMAVTDNLELITFDGDQTLYSDGCNFSDDELAGYLIGLMRYGINVVILTAAGYGFIGEKYEHRLMGLMKHFKEMGLTEQEMGRFFVMGGECNYLMRCNAEGRLSRVPDEQLLPLPCNRPLLWEHREIERMLNIAEQAMRQAASELHLRSKVIRKERSVGLIPGGDEGKRAQPRGHGSLKLKYEALDEVALRTKEALRTAEPPVKLPYCSFNGGRDAWIDVGNKAIGIQIMQALLKVEAAHTLHVGDQFLGTGNDIAAREVSPCVWINAPAETKKILNMFYELAAIPVPSLASKVEATIAHPEMDVYTGRGLGEKQTKV